MDNYVQLYTFAYFLIIVTPYVFLFENALSYLRSTKYLVENTMSKHDDKEEVITKIDALVQNDIYSDDDNNSWVIHIM